MSRAPLNTFNPIPPVQIMSRDEKLSELQRILRSKPQGSRIIIFCTTKRMCDQLSYR